MTIEQQLQELKREVEQLKRKLSERPTYFGKKFANFLTSANFIKGVKGWRMQDNGEVEVAILGLASGNTAPSTVADVAQIYIDSADGDLKVKFGNGTTKTISTN